MNRTYGTHEKRVYLHISAINIWSYLLWSPAIVVVDGDATQNRKTGLTVAPAADMKANNSGGT